MGQTILITVGEPDVSHDITFYPGGVVYVCPEADGSWTLLDCYHQDGRSRVAGVATGQPFSDLESAVYAAHDYIVQVERTREAGVGYDPVGPRNREKRRGALLAAAILRGEVDLIGGCLDLVASLRAARLENDPDALRLVGFCSDTDAFPRGAARKLWNDDALAENDAERERYIDRWRETVVSACRALETKLGRDDPRE